VNGYSRSTTPALPAERIKLLREAHWRMFTDPECQEDIFLKGWNARPVNGEDSAALAKKSSINRRRSLRN
jgi:hypothetical protein